MMEFQAHSRVGAGEEEMAITTCPHQPQGGFRIRLVQAWRWKGGRSTYERQISPPD